jgi:short-subunit dehydrogenase
MTVASVSRPHSLESVDPLSEDHQPDPDFVSNYGPWALIVGASEGTGAALATLAAAKGCNVILVARRLEKLEDLAAELRQTYGVEARTRSLDLALPDAAAQLSACVGDRDLGLVIFNAGGDTVGGRFLDSSYTEWRLLIQRNIDLLTEACHRFGTDMARRGKGGIVLIGSEAAFQGTGRLAIYSATKGYALNLGESLWHELKPAGVDVLNVLIGATDTPKLRAVLAKNGLASDAVPLTQACDIAHFALTNLANGPTVILEALADDENPMLSARLRRERVKHHSQFLSNFFGPE